MTFGSLGMVYCFIMRTGVVIFLVNTMIYLCHYLYIMLHVHMYDISDVYVLLSLNVELHPGSRIFWVE